MPDPLLSVIIPVGPAEEVVPTGLLRDLERLPENSEVIFVGCDEQLQTALFDPLPSGYQTLFSVPGRANQMNAGASVASGEFLWFLHLDSRFQPRLFQNLLEQLQLYPDCLHYHLLEFVSDGKVVMGLNASGANWRSTVLGVPFGDQGFAINKELFLDVGQYPVSAPYGEDHVFVWHARQAGVKLKCNPHKLQTSARKYQQKGRLYLTLKYQYLWIAQALPEALKLLKSRYFSPRCQR